ncbi:hypothetical protein [Ketobacter alkanivorans]|uniref:Uncharacterized protein n=1 Tax=Ketobacter alkanivorans TaxID=1917421 RepID=A0A2K9LJF0_9GAMM|nr:hypothetical protein [Ketobacter alkanivorans]AUM12468.1 hypothetical protein Kalk_08560 [Ketobacter alkanivorans]
MGNNNHQEEIASSGKKDDNKPISKTPLSEHVKKFLLLKFFSSFSLSQRKLLRIMFYAWFIWVVGFIISALYLLRKSETLAEVAKDNFWISFYASAAEDALFFIILTAIVILISSRKPEEETIDNKISFLFNDESLNAKQYAKRAIERLACYSPQSTVRISVHSYNSKIDAFKVITKWDFNLTNIYNNFAYENDDSLHVDIDTDDIYLEDEIRGALTHLQLCPIVSSKHTTNTRSYELQNDEQIKSKFLKKKIHASIGANEAAKYEVEFWMWCKNGEPYHQWVRRFTEKYVIKVTNDMTCGKSITVECQPPFDKTSDISDPEHRKIELKPNQSEVIYSGTEMTPDDDMWICISGNGSTPEDNHKE